ncbi:hypothetical protein AVEN_99649-1 [Araneus ventricosus]|uniref:Uncharacterized protein n=1 Tax=Araneus ventricosus TaxID=182803 RepID=A0A4Y2DNK5_ARAVE|nr:hypothetical protein AVEN_99649-1 [Araneus ventricosus]
MFIGAKAKFGYTAPYHLTLRVRGKCCAILDQVSNHYLLSCKTYVDKRAKHLAVCRADTQAFPFLVALQYRQKNARHHNTRWKVFFSATKCLQDTKMVKHATDWDLDEKFDG